MRKSLIVFFLFAIVKSAFSQNAIEDFQPTKIGFRKVQQLLDEDRLNDVDIEFDKMLSIVLRTHWHGGDGNPGNLVAKMRFRIAQLKYEKAKKILGFPEFNDQDPKQREDVLTLLLGAKDMATGKRNGRGAYNHFLNVFLKYTESPCAFAAAEQAEGIKEILVDVFGASLKTQVTPEKMEIAKKVLETSQFEEWTEEKRDQQMSELTAIKQAALARVEAREKAERDWQENKDKPNFKFPLNADFQLPLDFYKEVKTGVSLEWVCAYLNHESFSNVQFRASNAQLDDVAEALGAMAALGAKDIKIDPGYLPPEYLNPTNVVFMDGTREVSLYFGSVAPDKPQILVSGRISFESKDITADTLVEKYRKALPLADFSLKEETFVEGGGTILGFPVPKLTKRYSISSFSSGKSTVSVRSLEGVSVDHVTPLTNEKHHVAENGKYSGPDVISDPFAYIGTSELEGSAAGEAIKAWAKANEKKGSTIVTITDGPLSEASLKAYAEAEQRAKEKAKREAVEAEKQKRALEAERADSF